MLKKYSFLFPCLFLLFFFLFVFTTRSQEEHERGVIAVYFMEEQVGYEEYSWQSDETGYLLSVRGRVTKLVAIEIESLTISLDKSFIPLQYYFKGSISGVEQEISSSIIDGRVENVIHALEQEQRITCKIKTDAFLLPSAVFSPYIVITKKFGCNLQQPLELSAYIIPQIEIPFTLEPMEIFPCSLLMQLGTKLIELETDYEGNLVTLQIPSQNIRIVHRIVE
ncbi:MAG: hypothetical protein HQ555_09105 [Candidatus Aminicenantes bacterium]|nr:hypothetical protein [Candidatus Aminicenantes bacterium]